jgi:hypothetical protein
VRGHTPFERLHFRLGPNTITGLGGRQRSRIKVCDFPDLTPLAVAIAQMPLRAAESPREANRAGLAERTVRRPAP